MKTIPFAFWCFMGLVGLALIGAGQAASLTVTSDRDDAVYSKGEKVSFRIRVVADGEPDEAKRVVWTILKNGLAPIASGTSQLQNGEATVSAKLDEPGFLLCEAGIPGEKPGLGAAAVDPFEIRPSAKAPQDFDGFWKDQLKRLQAVPKNFKVSPVPSPLADVATFDVQGDCADKEVSGYFARPEEAAKGSLPAILLLHGAGVGSARLEMAANWAKKGMLALDINAHGLPNGEADDFYASLASGDLKDYPKLGQENRESVYFLGMFLRVVRALDFLTSQPEWDGRTLVVFGGSQGGAQALAGAALDDRVSFYVAAVPAMCDHTGGLAGRDPGWPKFLPPGTTPSSRVQKAVPYFDMVNFASRIRAPGLFTVGFLDTTCPPATVYAAYNEVKGEKKIFNDIAAGHVTTPEAKRLMNQAVLDHVVAQRDRSATRAH